MKEEVEPNVAFCEVLRQQRMSRGLTHKSLGIRSGLPSRYLLELENGNKEPYLKTIHKLANGLGLSSSGFLKIIERRIYGLDTEDIDKKDLDKLDDWGINDVDLPFK